MKNSLRKIGNAVCFSVVVLYSFAGYASNLQEEESKTAVQTSVKYMDPVVLKECARLHYEEKIEFSRLLQRLYEVGVESFRDDLVCGKKVMFGREGDFHEEPFPDSWKPSPVASDFDVEGVKSAIAQAQQGSLKHIAFLHKIMESGAAYYQIYLGKQAITVGRNGDVFINKFS